MYIIEYQPPTALNRWRHRRRIRNMAERVIPRSYEWVMLAVAVDGDGREYIIPQKKAPQGTRGR